MRQRIDAAEVPTDQLAWQGFASAGFAVAGLFILRERQWIAGALFLLIGLFFVGVTVRTALGRSKYGAVHLDLEAPVVPGGPLRATLVSSSPIAGATSIVAQLRCIQTEWAGSGKNRHLSEQILWSTSATFPIQAGPGGSEAGIRFDLPADAPLPRGTADADGASPGIYWGVLVSADVKGVDLERAFVVPVVAGERAPDDLLRPRVKPVTPSPSVAGRHAEINRAHKLVSTVTAVVTVAGMLAFVGAIAMFFWGALPGASRALVERHMTSGVPFLALIVLAFTTYWAGTWFAWRRLREKYPDEPSPMWGALWSAIVLAMIAVGIFFPGF